MEIESELRVGVAKEVHVSKIDLSAFENAKNFDTCYFLLVLFLWLFALYFFNFFYKNR